MKILVKLVVLVLVVVVIAVAGLFFYVDAIAKTAIERGATHALGVETTVASTDVGILEGKFSLSGLRVANPPGFDAADFLKMGEGDVSVSFASLREDTVRLPTLNLNDLDLSLEQKGEGANYDVILGNLKKLESEPKAPSSGEPGKKFIINEIVIRNVKVAVDVLPIGGSLTRMNVPIDEIRLQDVGSDSDTGVLMAELTSIILKAVFASVVNFGANLPADLLQNLGNELGQLENLQSLGVNVVAGAGGALEDVTGQVGEVLGDVTNGVVGDAAKQAGGALDEVGKAADSALKGIGDLLGGDKKDK